MSEPKLGGAVEQHERLIKFVLIPGRPARQPDADEWIQVGQPMGWFVRPEGSLSSRIEAQEPGSLASYLVEIYGTEYLDFIVGFEESSDQLQNEAQALVELLNDPEIQKGIRDIIHQKKKLAEGIRKSEQEIEKRIAVMAERLGTEYFGPKEEWELHKKE
ncbi:hypothetical protein EXS71_00690 [Candidatus Uhrbacteria bacterium]|nr:hypothetical protein [Candidatus Uhrbacteria bacterium]